MNTQLMMPVVTGTLNDQLTQLVDARLLHAFLASQQDFSTWIKARIRKYGFVEQEDFCIHKSVAQLPSGAKHRIDYWLSLDMAKELSMVERTPRGRQARHYFIDCERELHRLQQGHIPVATVQPTGLGPWERQAINRQAWAEVAGVVYAQFHARREELLRERGQTQAPPPQPQEKPQPARRFVFPPESVPRWAR